MVTEIMDFWLGEREGFIICTEFLLDLRPIMSFVVFLDVLKAFSAVTARPAVKGSLNPIAVICPLELGVSRAWPRYQGTGPGALP